MISSTNERDEEVLLFKRSSTFVFSSSFAFEKESGIFFFAFSRAFTIAHNTHIILSLLVLLVFFVCVY